MSDNSETLTIDSATSIECYSSQNQMNSGCSSTENAVCFKDSINVIDSLSYWIYLDSPPVNTNQLLTTEPVQKWKPANVLNDTAHGT